MKMMADVFKALRKHNKKNYRLYVICTFLATMLITAYGIMMYAPTVRMVLPEGGDSRKQVMAIFALAGVGCLVFIIYGGSLFYRMKSRELGTLLALGTNKKILAGQLFREMIVLNLASGFAGVVCGIAAAYLIWQGFRLFIVDSAQMKLVLDYRALIISLVFLILVLLAAFIQGKISLKRTNIMDIINESRRSEPIKDVAPWFGPVGIILIFVGAIMGYEVPAICIVRFQWYPPAIINLLYLPVFIGLYMLLLHVVVRGGSKKHPYKGIITKNMMKFQGRQTVNHMLVVTVLLAGAAFAIFYAPMMWTGAYMSANSWEYDYQFHYRNDQDILNKINLEALAEEKGVVIKDYSQVPVLTMGIDGQNFIEDKNNKYHYEYAELLSEGNFISESSFEKIMGQEISIEESHFGCVISPDGVTGLTTIDPDITKVTNMETRESCFLEFQEYLYSEIMAGKYYVLNDDDFEKLSRYTGKEWSETLVSFQAENDTYDFSDTLFDQIIDNTDSECELPDCYDRVDKIVTNEKGGIYWGDTAQMTKISFSDRDSSDFRIFWKYMPKFRELEKNDFVRSMAVFLMIFIFIAIICMAASILVLYIRSLTIAINNRRVFDDLVRLGAGPEYLFRAVRGQLNRIYVVPAAVGFSMMYILYMMIMYANDGIYTMSELAGLGVCLLVVLLFAAIIYGCYRFTRKKVLEMLGISFKTGTKA